MAKQFAGSAKFQIPGGQATPAPPVGTSLGKYGINLGQFVQQFNERTKEERKATTNDTTHVMAATTTAITELAATP